MTLVLHGAALNDEPMSRPLVGRFDERGGTLGRSDTATFTLPDPERLISRLQAQVVYRDEGYWIENISAASPILHNGRPLSAGMQVMLREGDELKIGGYHLVAAFEDDANSATILRGRTVILPPLGAPSAHKTAIPASLPPTPVRPPQGSPPAIGDESAWQQFLAAADIDGSGLQGTPPELLGAIGTLLRIAVEGLFRLVAMRAAAKGDMQAELTMIQVRGNNPLKFAPDPKVALRMLLQPPPRGFLDGPAALRDALVDLQSHQVGMVAGMRSAVERLLDRFDPAQLEGSLATRSVFDSLRPTQHKARLWDSYTEHYSSLRAEAREDFDRFFGEAFRQAYQAQARSLEAVQDPTARLGAAPQKAKPAR